jgi:hypothetical protein
MSTVNGQDREFQNRESHLALVVTGLIGVGIVVSLAVAMLSLWGRVSAHLATALPGMPGAG